MGSLTVRVRVCVSLSKFFELSQAADIRGDLDSRVQATEGLHRTFQPCHGFIRGAFVLGVVIPVTDDSRAEPWEELALSF